jgi:hypothetical protein
MLVESCEITKYCYRTRTDHAVRRSIGQSSMLWFTDQDLAQLDFRAEENGAMRSDPRVRLSTARTGPM